MDKAQTAPAEIRIYYNPERTNHKKTLAHAKGSGKAVSSFSYSDAPTAYNVWMTIFEGLTEDEKNIFSILKMRDMMNSSKTKITASRIGGRYASIIQI